MPRGDRLPPQCKFCGKKRRGNNLSVRGVCHPCFLIKARKDGTKGGRNGLGAAKQRWGFKNGRKKTMLKSPRSWKKLDLSIEDFEVLLEVLHRKREK